LFRDRQLRRRKEHYQDNFEMSIVSQIKEVIAHKNNFIKLFFVLLKIEGKASLLEFCIIF